MKESLKDKMEYHNSVIKDLEQKITILQKIIDAAYIDKLDDKSQRFLERPTGQIAERKRRHCRQIVGSPEKRYEVPKKSAWGVQRRRIVMGSTEK